MNSARTIVEKVVRSTSALSGFTGTKGKSLLGDVFTFGIGAAIAQLLGLALTPILTRLYSPEDFGVFSVASATISALIPIASASYILAIMLPKEEDEASRIFSFSVYFITAFTAIAYCGSLIGSRYVSLGLLNSPTFITAVSIGIWIGGVNQALTALATRRRHIAFLSTIRVTAVLLTIAAQIGIFFLLGHEGSGLLVGALVGSTVTTWLLARRCLHNFVTHSLKQTWEDLRVLGRRYRSVSLFSTGGTLMDTLSIQLVPILMARSFNVELVGCYALAYTVVTSPITLIGRSISQGFFSHGAAERHSPGGVRAMVVLLLPRLIAISAFMSLVLYLAAPFVFAIIFGDRWNQSGQIVQILIPLFFFQFIANALSPAFILLERTRALCIVQALLLCATLFPFVLGPVLSDTPYFVLGLYSGAQALAYFVYCWALCYVTEISIRDLVARSWLTISSLWSK